MKRYFTKAVSLLLTLLIVIGCVPMTVLAEVADSLVPDMATGPAMAANDQAAIQQMNQGIVSTYFSPYEPYATKIDDHPFLQGGSAWIDLSQLYYGAPATQNYPLTKWSANTSVYNITGTGRYYTEGDGVGDAKGQEIYAFPDVNLIDEFTWQGYREDQRLYVGNKNNNIFENGVVSSAENVKYHGVQIVTSKNGTQAYAYNRYDAMQGKYGITLDRNVKSVCWEPSWADDYYGANKDLYGSVVYLSDTPYLYFSTEALDSTKMAISLLIGSPVQQEVLNNESGRTVVTNTTKYEYRWYTITDNSDRPGIGTDTLGYSMIPNITISDVVATVEGQTGDKTNAFNQQSSLVVPAVYNAGNGDPLALAATKGINTDEMYVSGSITGCLDFTNIVPIIMGADPDNDNGDGGREDVQYKVAQVRVDIAGDDSASRVNYMYFGPSLSTNFTPQNTVGQHVNAQSWQYAQASSNTTGTSDTTVGAHVATTADTERAYTSGWENGMAVSIVNTPNTPQLMTVDTYGKGDGQLIEWANVPAGADILRGNYKENDSKVWKFTDTNGVTRYMEAQYHTTTHSGIKGCYYIMVTVPVRKWINVLGESRKISLTATLLQAGQEQPILKPTFTLWGNEDGSLGCGHSGPGYGSRFRNEDLVLVFATDGQTYHTDQGQDYIAAEVDRTIGDSLIYNAEGETKESWFDTLRSPYTYQETVTDNNRAVATKLTDDHIGYTFITSLRFAMPVGSAISVQNMKGDGNSAGLNMYSTSGTIVSAYDGGTGEQPNIDVDNTLPELNMTYDSTNKTYSGSTLDSNGINGYITSGAAAYGPMLEQSFYTIYDMLDTEMLRATGKDSHYNTLAGKNKQPVYGEVWLAKSDLTIYHVPSSTVGVAYGHVYGGSQFVVYGTVIRTDSNRNKWGLVGVLTKNGSTEIGWVLIYDGAATSTRISGVPYFQDVEVSGDVNNINQVYGKNIVSALKNDWVISDFSSIDDGGDFRDGTNTNFEYTSNFRNNSTNAALGGAKYDPGQNIVSKAYNGPQFKYANKWTGGSGHYSCGYSLQDFYLRSINGTDMEWGFKRNVNTDKNLSMAITRVFENPIRLKQGKTHIHQSYPVLYLDYTATTEFKIGISLRVDGADKIWYVYGNSNGLAYIAPDNHTVLSGNRYGYLSFEDIMTVDYKDASTIEVTAMSLYMWNGTSVSEGNVVIRRCEIWQEETDWLDEIIADNQYSGGNSSTAMNCTVKDSMNIINDSYFHTHSETDDGEITVDKKGDYASSTNIGINNANKGFEFTYTDGTKTTAMDYWENNVNYKYNRTESYRKENSNKGWRSYLRVDTTKDGEVNELDTTYYGHNATSVDGVYQYFSSLGHLRVWVPSQTQASLVFESDRSFNTKNYKYLYYSYSMRDADTGIAAEEPDTARTDSLRPGISVAIKQNQLGAGTAYSEIMMEDGTRTWAYYDSNNSYWQNDDQDNRTFKTTINAALDLSSLQGIESVNQFVFYLNNPLGELGDGDKAEFYINYLYLSNVPPTTLISSQLKEEAVQYYYMMDNTGDRYSARFPTIDNPTGQVSGLNGDNDRVNPVVVKRGDRLSDGKYFNGDLLYGYGEATNRAWNEDTFSEGYYEKLYGIPESMANADANGSFKNIWFYAGTSEEITDINDYYQYKDRDRDHNADGTIDKGENDGVGDIYDMLWSYGRWYTGTGESGLNSMYIGNQDAADFNPATDTHNAVSGNLVRRYATENYVLLRSGIEPRKYLTYYDTDGGQMYYEGSGDDILGGIYKNENNYYITQTVINSPFSWPIHSDKTTVTPVKYGHTFKGWHNDHIDLDGDGDSYSTTDENDGTLTIGPELLHKYNRKKLPDYDFFYAQWEDDPAFADVTHAVTFMSPADATQTWFTVNADAAHDFIITLPTVSQASTVDGRKTIVGWYDATEENSAAKTVYPPGAEMTITKAVTFKPMYATSTDDTLTIDITVKNAKLYFVRDTTTEADILAGKNLTKPEQQNITVTENGSTRSYVGIPRNAVCVLIPDTATSGKVWQSPKTADDTQALYLNGATGSVLSANYQYYKFIAYNDIDTINYTSVTGVGASTPTITTAPQSVVANRQMMFFSQYDLSNISGATFLAAGTLYTKAGKNFDALNAGEGLAANMQLNASTVNEETIGYEGSEFNGKATYQAKSTAVRYVQATSASSTGQYAFMVTENKGNEAQYYVRGYVIYKQGGAIKIAYSDIVAYARVEANATLAG